MKRSWLIQRLQSPYPGCENNPFNFGGGYARGGIEKNIYAELNRIFRFDYMGAAEFEFGIIPKSLGRILTYYAGGESVNGMVRIHGMPVYYLCYNSDKAEVEKRIKDLSQNKVQLKEYTLFSEALASRVPFDIVPEKAEKYKKYKEYIGWLELDNDFIFFLDKEILERFTGFMDTCTNRARDTQKVQETEEKICQPNP